jgi:hypothetical protein
MPFLNSKKVAAVAVAGVAITVSTSVMSSADAYTIGKMKYC